MENKNDNIIIGTLMQLRAYNANVICHCRICNQDSVLTKTDFQSGVGCQVCKAIDASKVNYVPSNKTEEADCQRLINNYNKHLIRNNTRSITSRSEFNGIIKGSTYGDLTVIGFIGKANKNFGGVSFDAPTEIMMACKYCGMYHKIVNIDDFKNYLSTGKGLELDCPNCREIFKPFKKRVAEVDKQKATHDTKMEARQTTRMSAKKTDEGTSQLVKRILSPFDTAKEGSKAQTIIDNVKNANPYATVLDIDNSGIGYNVICSCNKCGTRIVIPNNKRNKAKECEGCKIKAYDSNYIGEFNKDYTGVVKNLYKLISRDGDKCVVECVTCKNQETVRFYDWYAKKIICNCSKNHVPDDELVCENCYEYVKGLSYADILAIKDDKKPLICANCGKEMKEYTPEYIKSNYIDAISYMHSYRNKFNAVRGKLKQTIKEINSTLYVASEPMYVGTDGNNYYKCYCKEHDTELILNDDEYSAFNHKQCYDRRQHILNEFTKENVEYKEG
jgi:hypothetical protein